MHPSGPSDSGDYDRWTHDGLPEWSLKTTIVLVTFRMFAWRELAEPGVAAKDRNPYADSCAVTRPTRRPHRGGPQRVAYDASAPRTQKTVEPEQRRERKDSSAARTAGRDRLLSIGHAENEPEWANHGEPQAARANGGKGAARGARGGMIAIEARSRAERTVQSLQPADSAEQVQLIKDCRCVDVLRARERRRRRSVPRHQLRRARGALCRIERRSRPRARGATAALSRLTGRRIAVMTSSEARKARWLAR